MTARSVEKILHDISLDILKYEDGDLMFVSDLMDRIGGLESAYPAGPETARLFALIRGCLNRLMHGEPYRAIDGPLAHGIDLLARIAGQALRENYELAALPLEEIAGQYGAEVAQLAATAGNGLAAAPERLRREAASGGELELRVAGEPFKVFLSEAEEKIIHAQDFILELEKDSLNSSHVNELFRIFHTIKGECGFLRIGSLGELAHNLENLLDLLRDGKLKADASLIDLLFRGIDEANRMLSALKNGDLAAFGRIDIAALVADINALVQRTKTNIGTILIEQGKLNESDVEIILRKQKESSFTRKFGEIAVEEHLITPEELAESLQNQTAPKQDSGPASGARDSIVKVKASQINFLVDMVGELIISEAQLDERTKNLGQLRKITREIQYAAMQLRTEKVKNLFITMKRVARDAAKKLGKRVTAEMRGEDMEIDRDLVEKLEEPLMHLVRNAVAHGIEGEEERLARGKSAEGKVVIASERRGNTIVIAIEDDGRGLDREKIVSKAIERNLVAAEAADRLSDAEVYNFVFEQGFSTAENVDFVSGRGVGMDIVKTVTAAARGRVEIRTERGRMTRTEMIFPLSTAIIDGMIVKSHGTHFIVPVSNVIESLRLDPERIFKVKGEVEVIDLRQEIIPIIRLHDYFGQNGRDGNGAAASDRLIAVIVENNERKKIALLLDEIITKREVFIKALGAKFRDLPGISSGTILQGGTIGFVLDIDQLTADRGRPAGAVGVAGAVSR